MPHKVTIRSIAEKAGVSPMTVSYALRNHPKISEARRIMIQEIAQEMGYTIDPEVQRLMKYLRNQREGQREPLPIALFDAGDQPGSYATIEYYKRIIKGAETFATNQGYYFEHFYLGDYPRLKRLDTILKTRNIQGIFLPLKPPEREIDFPWQNYYTVCSTHNVAHPNMHRVVPYQSQHMMLAMENLIAKGYQRIGFICADYLETTSRHRYTAAYLLHHTTHPELAAIPPLIYKDWKKEIPKWLKTHQPDVIIGSGYYLEKQICDLTGIKVPQDLGFISLDGNDTTQAHIDQCPERIGATALSLLTSALVANERGLPKWPLYTHIEGQWQDGRTLTARKRAKLKAS